jgi:hypothetical protein
MHDRRMAMRLGYLIARHLPRSAASGYPTGGRTVRFVRAEMEIERFDEAAVGGGQRIS